VLFGSPSDADPAVAARSVQLSRSCLNRISLAGASSSCSESAASGLQPIAACHGCIVTKNSELLPLPLRHCTVAMHGTDACLRSVFQGGGIPELGL